MAVLLSGKIDLSKIDKDRLFKSGATGSVYLDVTIWVNEDEDEFGNHGSIQQQLTKDEREANMDKIYICLLYTSPSPRDS